MNIDALTLKVLRTLTAQRTRYANTLGVAFVEMELAKAKALSQPDAITKVGAAQVEFEGYRNRYMAKIAASGKQQEEVGKAALRSLGLDPDGKVNYTIDLQSGAVLRLDAGKWEPVQ